MVQAQRTDALSTLYLSTLYNEAKSSGVQVFGEGNPRADLMLVGEAPGREEAESGRPFVGAAGKVLSALLNRLAIPREKIWITNTYKIRPVAERGPNLVNRPPRPSEVKAHRWILDREIEIIRPHVIVCLGSVAATALIHPNFRVKADHGCWFDGPHGSKIMATYHPSYLLRLRGPDYETARDEMMADLSKAWGEALAQAEKRAVG